MKPIPAPSDPKELTERLYAAVDPALRILRQIEEEERLPLDSLFLQLVSRPPDDCALLKYLKDISNAVEGVELHLHWPGTEGILAGAEEGRGALVRAPGSSTTREQGGQGNPLVGLGYVAVEVITPSGQRKVRKIIGG